MAGRDSPDLGDSDIEYDVGITKIQEWPYAGPVTSFEIGPRERAAINRFNAMMQPMLDRLRIRCAGRPMPEVRDELAKAWGANAGKPLPEPYLSDWAARLSAGERVVLG